MDCPGMVSEASSFYTESYLKSFVPVFRMVNVSAESLSLTQRYNAIKFAADASLALTARGATWSDALSRQLCLTEEEEGVSAALLEGEVSRSCGDSALLSSTLPSDGGDEKKCRPECRVLGNNSAISSGCKGIRKNWRKNYVSFWDSNRLSMLRKLTAKRYSKRRVVRSSWRTKIPLRKAKSTKARNRLCRSRSIASRADRDETFESGIVALQRLVPGGPDMDAALLLDETVDFVMFLKFQVQALQTLANAVDLQPELNPVPKDLNICMSMSSSWK